MTKSTNRGRGGNPPKEYQFRKGMSGNPSGRPPKPRNEGLAGLVRKHFGKRVTMVIGQKQQSVSKLEAGLARYANEFVTGKQEDRRRTIELLSKTGLLDGPGDSPLPQAEAIEKFVQELAEEARRSEEAERDRQASRRGEPSSD